MSATPLTRELVKNPERHRLLLSISATAINVLVAPIDTDDECLAASIELGRGAGATSLEEAVYANPLLLLPFNRVDIVIVTERFHILPPATAGNAAVCEALDELIDRDHCEAFADAIDSRNSQLTLLPRETARFLHRTFDTAVFHGHLAVLGRYLAGRSRLGNTGKLFVNLRRDSIDLLAFDSLGLSVANTIACSDDNDALYYILAVARTAGLDLANDEVLLCGDQRRRAALMQPLATYVAGTMPLIVPAALTRRLPGNSEVPLELIVL